MAQYDIIQCFALQHDTIPNDIIKIKIVIIVITIIIIKIKIKIKINSEKYSKIKLEGRHLPWTFDISSFSAANSWSAPREKN